MKTVFKNSMVAHVWAQRTQANGRSSKGNFFFDGDTIYSYGRHFPIAKFVTNKRGETAVMYRNISYSSSTGRHQSYVRRAVNGTIFTVTRIDNRVCSEKTNLDDYAARILSTAKKAMKARTNRDWLMREAGALVEQANRYAAFVGSRRKFTLPDTEEIKRAADLAKRREAKALRDQEAKQRKAEADAMENVREWQSGGSGSVPYFVRKVYLRLKTEADGTQDIETSKGAVVPLDHAKRLLPIVRAGRAVNGEVCDRIHLGHFHLDRVEANGTIRAGCHTIERDEIERIAAQIGL